MPAMLSFILEWGISTVGSNARWALRMRASMSEIGSFIILPTGLGHTRNQPREGCFTKGHAGAAKLAQVAVPAPAHRAPVDHARRAGIAWQFGQPGVIPFGLQFRPQSGVLLDRLGLLLIAFNPCSLSHSSKWGNGVME